MDKDAVYALLEQKFMTWVELSSVPVADNGEAMVSLRDRGLVVNAGIGAIPPSTGDDIFARASVALRLAEAAGHVAEVSRGTCRLEIVYGYRHPAIQNAAYLERKAALGYGGAFETDAVREAIHRSVAVPGVAGHPTGGAVDVRLADGSGIPVDMGTGVHDFSRDSYVFSPFIGRESWQNRQLLRHSMMKAGFAPFDGEWWHFSYGDREWARFHGAAAAFYAAIDFSRRP